MDRFIRSAAALLPPIPAERLRSRVSFLSAEDVMKHLLFSSLLVLFIGAIPASAQPLVLFDRYEVTGFLAPALSVSEIRGQTSYTLGVCAALMIDHATVVGIEGGGLISGVEGPSLADGAGQDLQMFFAGLLLEHIEQPGESYHLVWRVMIGGGEIGYAAEIVDPGGAGRGGSGQRDAFVLFEPGAGVEYNVGGKARVELTAHYRFIRDVDLVRFDRRDAESLVVQMMVKIGSF
jgi:hypothetical protein